MSVGWTFASTRRPRALLATALAGVALIAWLMTVQAMRGMDAGPGTDLGGFGWFIATWVTMMAAMMLPSAMPAVTTFARFRSSSEAVAFVGGYMAAWACYGVLAYVIYRGVRATAPGFVAWDAHGPLVAGAALAAAGVYQLTPLKSACLRHCRSPLGLIVRGSPGRLAATRTGVAHGAFCVGCCMGLMLALFALGVMSLVWMAGVTLAILLEKVLPAGLTSARALGVALIALGLWTASAPSTVPGLTQPGTKTMNGMMQR